MQLTETHIAHMTEILKRHPVTTAYLFGSQSTGKAGTLSDIDIGVLLENKSAGAHREKILTAIFVDLARALHTDFIDVVDLAQAPTLLAYNIVTKGQKLFTKDASATHRFAFHALQQYEDFRFHLNTQQRLIKQHFIPNV